LAAVDGLLCPVLAKQDDVDLEAKDVRSAKIRKSVDGDKTNDWLRSVASPALVARMDRADERLKTLREREAELQAEFDSLPIDEARNRAVMALSSAADLLRHTPVNRELESHGWTPEFATRMAEECDRLRDMVELGTYPKDWRGYGLGRSLLEEIDPTTTDSLKRALHRAESYLRAMSSRRRF
jgi:hypothetical protein